MSTCPVDEDAVLLRRSELIRILREITGIRVTNSGYTLLFPGALKWLRRFERSMRWLPAGGQYFVLVQKTTGTA